MLPRLRTEHLILRPWSSGDVDALHRIWNDQEVRRFLWDDVVISRERAAEMVQAHAETVAECDIGCWAVYAAAGQEMIGFCGFRFIPGTEEIELLYGLLPQYWGAGFATEASRSALSYLWRFTAFPRVWARSDAPNVRSIALMRRIGMQPGSSTDIESAYVLQRPAVLTGAA